MKIYNVIIEDRHTDVVVYPFTDKDKAIEQARKKALNNCVDQEDYEEIPFDEADGNVMFMAIYSCEGVHYDPARVSVVSSDLDKEIE